MLSLIIVPGPTTPRPGSKATRETGWPLRVKAKTRFKWRFRPAPIPGMGTAAVALALPILDVGFMQAYGGNRVPAKVRTRVGG